MTPTTERIIADGIVVHCAHTKLVRTSELRPNPRNPNIHPKEQIKAFAKIVQTLGWRSPIVVSKLSGLITKGHGRLEVARYLDAREVPVDYQDYKSEEEEWSDILADNKIAEDSERDEVAVAGMLKELSERGANTSLTGYRDAEVEKMLSKLAGDATATEAEPDDAEELLKKWPVARGEVWACGEHRIMYGDATAPGDWQVLMAGQLAQLIHTDPPYGVDYDATRDRLKSMDPSKQQKDGVAIKADDIRKNELSGMVGKALALARAHSHADAAFYVWHASSTRRDFEAALDAAGLQERQYITWVKENISIGISDYHWQTEPCFYCEKAGQRAKWQGSRTTSTVWRLQKLPNDGTPIDLATGLHLTDGGMASLFLKAQPPKTGKFRHLRVADAPVFISDRSPTDAWQVSREDRTKNLHPTQKPAELAEIAIANSSAAHDIVVDCFGGSFSTLVGAHTLKRRAYVMDLEPKYCAVGIERWHRLTGEKPVRAA